MHQIIFIEGFSGIGKSTLAKRLHEHFKGVYLEQHMIADFKTKDGENEIFGREEDETLYCLMKVNIKEFCRLGFKNIIALDFNPVRFRDIPEDFKGYDFLILHLVCKDMNQNLSQMKNRGNGLIDFDMIKEDYQRQQNHPREKLPNEVEIDVTHKSPEQVFEEAVKLLSETKSELEYVYDKPACNCFGTWVLEDKQKFN